MSLSTLQQLLLQVLLQTDLPKRDRFCTVERAQANVPSQGTQDRETRDAVE